MLATGRKAVPPPLLSPGLLSPSFGQAVDELEEPLHSWDIFNEYAEGREDVNPEIRALSPASASWQVSAHSDDGRFPTTFYELERIPIADIVDGFIDNRRLGTDSIYLKGNNKPQAKSASHLQTEFSSQLRTRPESTGTDDLDSSPSDIYSHYDRLSLDGAVYEYDVSIERSKFSPISPEEHPDFVIRLSGVRQASGDSDERVGLRGAAKAHIRSAAYSVGQRAEEAFGKAEKAVDKVLAHFKDGLKSPAPDNTENVSPSPRSSLDKEDQGTKPPRPKHLFLPLDRAEMNDIQILPIPRSASPEPVEITIEAALSRNQEQEPPLPSPSPSLQAPRSPGLPSHPAMHLTGANRSPQPSPTFGFHRRAHSANPTQAEFDRRGPGPAIVGTTLGVNDDSQSSEGNLNWNRESLFTQPRRAPPAPAPVSSGPVPGFRGRDPTSPRSASLDRYDASEPPRPAPMPSPTSPRTASLDRFTIQARRRGMALPQAFTSKPGFGFDFDLHEQARDNWQAVQQRNGLGSGRGGGATLGRKVSKALPPLPGGAKEVRFDV